LRRLSGCRRFNSRTNRYTTIPNHATLRAILKQAGIDPDDFLKA